MAAAAAAASATPAYLRRQTRLGYDESSLPLSSSVVVSSCHGMSRGAGNEKK